MPTFLQKNLAKEIILNAKRKKPLNKGQLVESGGYSKTVAEAKPTEILNQKGVREELRNFGLTEDLIRKSLVFDIKKKPKNRVKELALGADILGMRENKDKQGTQVAVVFLPLELMNKHGITPSPESNSPGQAQIQSN